MKEYKCSICGSIFKSDKALTSCPNCKRKAYTSYYKLVAIAVIIIGLVIGLLLSDGNNDMMLYIWCGALYSSIPIFAIHSICHRLDLLIDQKKD